MMKGGGCLKNDFNTNELKYTYLFLLTKSFYMLDNEKNMYIYWQRIHLSAQTVQWNSWMRQISRNIELITILLARKQQTNAENTTIL